MNEILFENKFVRDKAVIKEIYTHWYFKRPLMIAIFAYFGLYLVACLFAMIFSPEELADLIYPIVVIIFALFMLFLVYISSVNTAAKRDSELANGGELLCTVSVTDSEITNSALESNNKVSFDNVNRAFITKNYAVVVTKARIVYIFKKDSFTIGDTESFIAFLKSKGIKVRGKKN